MKMITVLRGPYPWSKYTTPFNELRALKHEA